jgi:DNA-binding SARP family transcriptional activator
VGRIERSKSIELIVYLALHPQGVTPDELWEALWPDRPVNRGTLHTTVTAARTGLGRAPDGTRYLPDAHDGHYRLSQQVGLDWARFHALIASGEDDGPDGLKALRSALELVRGGPLTSPTGRGYEWAVVHRTEMETVIAEAAERLALRYLDLGDHRQANWAARRGLLASPYDERLYRVLMRARCGRQPSWRRRCLEGAAHRARRRSRPGRRRAPPRDHRALRRASTQGPTTTGHSTHTAFQRPAELTMP